MSLNTMSIRLHLRRIRVVAVVVDVVERLVVEIADSRRWFAVAIAGSAPARSTTGAG